MVLSLILLLALILSFSKGATLFTPTYALQLRTENVAGLKGRSSVLVAGVGVGTVDGVQLAGDGRGVIIRLKVRKNFPIHDDARFVIEQIGFLGDQYIAVYPQKNEGRVLQDGDLVHCEQPFNFQEVARSAAGFIQRIDQTARMLNDAISRVDKLLLNEQTLTNFSGAIVNFRRVSDRAIALMDSLDHVVQSNAPPVALAVTNFVRFSEELGRLSADLRQIVSENRGEIQGAVKHIEAASQSVEALARELQAGQGVFGSLFKDEKLKTDFGATLANFAVASSNLSVFADNIAKHGLLYKPKPPKKEPDNRPRLGKTPFAN